MTIPAALPRPEHVAVAEEVVRCALDLARQRLGTPRELATKSPSGDLVTDVDLACERHIVTTLSARFPEHAIDAEETGRRGRDGPWRWVVDPLDGSNNYAYGLPVWGTSVALLHEDRPVLSCIGDGPSNAIITAVSGGGLTVDGVPWQPRPAGSHQSAAFWIGYGIDRTDRPVQAILSVLARSVRRTFENWAPTVDVGLYLRGALDVVVGYRCAGTELPAVLLALTEAGARVLPLGDGAGSPHGPASPARRPATFVAGRPGLAERIAASVGPAAPGA